MVSMRSKACQGEKAGLQPQEEPPRRKRETHECRLGSTIVPLTLYMGKGTLHAENWNRLGSPRA